MVEPKHILEVINLDMLIQGESQYCRVTLDPEDTSSGAKYYRITDGVWVETTWTSFNEARNKLRPFLP